MAADPPPRPHVTDLVDDTDLPLGLRPGGRGRLSAEASADDLGSPAAYCGHPAEAPVPDGSAISVSMPPAPPFAVGAIPASTWKNPPVSDPTWQMNFYAMRYLPPLATRAVLDGSTGSLETMLAQAVAMHVQHPDTGLSTLGWDEGTSLRRLQVLNCLYALSGDARLVGPMATNVAVLFSDRYYGPPNYMVHNHGLMANLAVIDAARLLAKSNWRAKALARVRAEAPLSFTPSGTTWEQSSEYQHVNLQLWDWAADVLAESDPTDSSIAVIRAVTRKAQRVFAWFTEPDGSIVQLGDPSRAAGSGTPTSGRTFRDDAAGVAVGRWSPTDPRTTYYTVRYGGPRIAHGHQERSGVTFTSAGVRVLVNPGRFNYDKKSPWNVYQLSAAAANTAIPARRPFHRRARVAVSTPKIQAPAHGWRMDDALYGVKHTRRVNVNGRTSTLTVTDTYPAGLLFRQNWHLDNGWTLVSGAPAGRRLTFRHTGGPRLTITTTGRLSSVVSGSTRPIAGWLFPKWATRLPAPHVTIRSTGRSVTTTFVVR